MRSTARALAVLGLGLPLVVGVAGPAAATATPPPLPPDESSSRTTYQTANVSWTEVDAGPDDPVPGNWHLGNLFVQRSGFGMDVFGSIDDFQCDPGETPGFGGHGIAPGEPAPGGQCDSLGTRFLNASPTLAFTVDIPGGTVRLRGALIASSGGHDGPGAELGRPGVDITWKKGGSFYRYTRAETWEDDTRSFSSSTRGLGWQATMSGTLGPMNFTDDADDVSFGSSEQYTERTRARSKAPEGV